MEDVDNLLSGGRMVWPIDALGFCIPCHNRFSPPSHLVRTAALNGMAKTAVC
jgi:hypothetical protein